MTIKIGGLKMNNYKIALKKAEKYFFKKNKTYIIKTIEAKNCWIFFGGTKGSQYQPGDIGIKINKQNLEIDLFALPTDNCKIFELHK